MQLILWWMNLVRIPVPQLVVLPVNPRRQDQSDRLVDEITRDRSGNQGGAGSTLS